MAVSPCSFAKIKKLYRKFAKNRDVFKFTNETGCYATVFEAAANEFVRISTTLPTQEGNRAVNTFLDRKSEAYNNLSQNKIYLGISEIDGHYYCEKVAPFIVDANGVVLIALGIACQIKLPEFHEKPVHDTIYL